MRLKLFLALCVAFVLTFSGLFANNYQGNWRWRNDDGNESTATWKTDINSTLDINDAGAFRLRVKMSSGNSVLPSQDFKLIYLYTVNDGTPHVITTNPNDGPFYLYSSELVPDGTPTTRQLPPKTPDYTFFGGSVVSSSQPFVIPELPALHEQEWEFCIKPSKGIKAGEYAFAIFDQNDINAGFPNPSIMSYIASPVVVPVQVASVTENSAIAVVNMVAEGVLPTTLRGICWNTAGAPTTSDGHTEESGSFGSCTFSLPITGLLPNTVYKLRAYAANELGTVYSQNEVAFTTVPTLGQWGLIAFGGLIAVIGGVAVWRRFV